MSTLEELFTDREFCRAFKVDRATSMRWREQGIVGYLKMPNGQLRYRQSHIDDLKERFEKLAALKDADRPVKSRVVNIGIAKRSGNVGVT